LGDAGTLKIDAGLVLLTTQGGITASTEVGNGGNIDLKVKDSIILRERSFISAEAKQLGNGGNINLNTDTIALVDRSSIVANAIEGMGGNIKITTQGLFVTPDSNINASSQFGLDGNIKIETIDSDRYLEVNKLPENPLDVTKKITKGCSVGANFAVVGNGGLPKNPIQTNLSSNIWTDLRSPDLALGFTQSLPIPANTTSKKTANSLARKQPALELQEAQSWKVNDRGQIELFALHNYPKIEQKSDYYCQHN
jgi:large exoprotein involved in heme utilization and adhesion